MGNFHVVSGGIILVYFLLPIKKLKMFTFSLSPYQLQMDSKKKSNEKGSH